jgi:cyanophycin synthetase
VKNVPITFDGRAEFNIANVLAACLAAYTNHIKLNTIRQGLKTFAHSEQKTPGRLNILDFNDFTVLLDYADNSHGIKALGKFIKSFEGVSKTGVITAVGYRDEDSIACAEEAAKVFDEVIIRHDKDLRGRTAKELDELLTAGIKKIDRQKPIKYFDDECEAADLAILNAQARSLVVILTDNISEVTKLY